MVNPNPNPNPNPSPNPDPRNGGPPEWRTPGMGGGGGTSLRWAVWANFPQRATTQQQLIHVNNTTITQRQHNS